MSTDEIRIDGAASGGRGTIPEGEGARFYSSAEFNQRLDLIRHLIRNSDRTLLIRGEDGVGKSMLLAWLQRLADAEWQICRIDANPMLQPDQLLHQLALCLMVKPDAADLLRRLQRQIEDLYQTGRLPLILVDDAHQLPLTSLIVLFRLQERSGQGVLPLRLVLFAIPQIDDVLRTPQLQAMNAQSVQQIDLLPLNLRQTEQLVQQVIQGEVGANAVMPSDSQLTRIHRESRGLPGQVEHLARRLSHGRRQAPANAASRTGWLIGIPRSVLAGAAILLLLIVLTLIYQDPINALFQGEGVKDQPPLAGSMEDQRIVPLLLPDRPGADIEQPALSEAAPAQSPGEPMTTDIPAAIPPGLTLPELNLPAEPEPAVVAVEPVAAAAIDSTQSPEAAKGEPGAVPLAQGAAEAELTPPAGAAPVDELSRPGPGVEKTAAAPSLSDQTTVEKPPPVTKVDAPESRTEKTLAAPVQDRSLAVATAAEEATGKAEPATRPAPPTPVRTPGRKDEAWLLQQNPGRFTLQLVGVQDEKSARAFIRQHQLQGAATYFRTTRNGHPWFSVVYGVYPGRGEAVAARSRLPGKLAKAGAWPRTLASVQEAIRSR